MLTLLVMCEYYWTFTFSCWIQSVALKAPFWTSCYAGVGKIKIVSVFGSDFRLVICILLCGYFSHIITQLQKTTFQILMTMLDPKTKSVCEWMSTQTQVPKWVPIWALKRYLKEVIMGKLWNWVKLEVKVTSSTMLVPNANQKDELFFHTVLRI